MRLGETGLNIVDYLDAVEDEILRDDVGQIYYKNKDGNIISTGKALRTTAMIDHILDMYQVEEANLEANIYIFPGHPSEINKTIVSNMKISNEDLNGSKCVLFCDTISSFALDTTVNNTVMIPRLIELVVNSNPLTVSSGELFDITEFISNSSSSVSITATQVSASDKYEVEYLVGIYLLILKEA